MNRTEWENNEMPETVLDALLDDVRAGEPDAEVMDAARARGWARLQAAAAASVATAPEAIENCAGFQALFPEYRERTLTPARRMLVEDHLHECVACRRVLHAESTPKVVTMPSAAGVARRKGASFWMPSKWAVAAMLMLAFGVGSWRFWEWFGPAPSGSRARVLSADGGVYRLDGNSLVPVAGGAELGEGVVLRTVGGGHASVRLLDGSTVEVGERAEFSVAATRRDTTVNLGRGQIIVQAAKRSSGHLYVASGDSRVAVTGTIFSVNRGVAGARVSVVEGEVHVEHGSQKDVLHAGDQVTTHPSIARTSVSDDIAWSRNVDEYLALLKQFSAIRGKLSEIHMPGLRYGSRLMDSVPEGASIYVSLPNLSNAIRDLQRIVNDQVKQSPALAEWMQKQMPQFEKVTTQLSRLGDYVGDEVLFVVQTGREHPAVAIAEVNRPGLKEYLEGEMAKAGARPEDMGRMEIAYAGNRVYIGEKGSVAQTMQASGKFAATPFGETIASVYRRGAGVFVAVDVERFVGAQVKQLPAALGNVRHFIAEQKEVNGKTEYSAVVSFAGQRTGVASWLSSPGAMGSLDFVSPDAQFATAFVAKQPALMLKDLLDMAEGRQMDFAEFERTVGVSVEQLAGFLGGEVAVAVDGPLIPVPSWKVVAEVRDPAGLQAALTKMAAAGQMSIQQTAVNGQTFYSVKSPFEKIPMEIHFTYSDGYLVAGSTRVLLERALRDRAAGISLTKSQEFRQLLPRESRPTFSGVVYQNAGDVLRMMTDAASSGKKLTPEQQKQADEIAASMKATVICFYGEADRIEMASQFEPASLLMKGLTARLFTGNIPGESRELPKQMKRIGN